jgi:hypothetical protein
MFKKQTTDAYFKIIKENHKRYLETNMVSHIDTVGMDRKKSLIQHYVSCISNYREFSKDALNDAIRSPTAAEKVSRGAVSSLIGMGIGGLAFAGAQRAPSMDLWGAKTAVQGGFAAAIGTSCSALIYKTWDSCAEKPAHADMKACEEEMKNAGFTHEKYTALSGELVKLFHFRESLLCGLHSTKKSSLRELFKKRYFSATDLAAFHDSDFNRAIEVYFLEQLNVLFNEAFQTIYQVHDQEIQQEKNAFKFMQWMKRHFESPENRAKFTQQLQLDFMKECIRFLEKQKSQRSFVGNYPFLMDLIVGVFAASIAIGVCAWTVFFIPTLAFVCIGIAAAAIAAVATHVTIVFNDALYYKRDKGNRASIQAAIDSIGKEQKRLNTLLQVVVKTSRQDLTALKTFDDENESSFSKIIHLRQNSNVALGGVRAWIREFTARFNESKLVEIDLSERIKSLVSDAHDQTDVLQRELVAWMTSEHPRDSAHQHVIKWINDTNAYLMDPQNAAFIKTFESIQKIKEQVLEVVGHLPRTCTKALPDALVQFYTGSVAEGGLNGLARDLDNVRRLALVIPDNTPLNAEHPYHQLLETTFAIQLKFNANPKAKFVFQGDSDYRKKLGLSSDSVNRIDDQLTLSTIQDYLMHSFNFLCTLDHFEETDQWDKPFQHTPAFMVYRMLLVKQFANLTDPNNLRVDPLIKDAIKAFAKQRLNCDPEVAFDDILNQALLVAPSGKGGSINDKLGNPCSISDLSYIADAIRVDVAYVSSPLSPQQLISFEADLFLRQNADQMILGCHAPTALIPECSVHFSKKITQAIATTVAFIEIIKTRELLTQTHATPCYLRVVQNETARLITQINTILSLPKDASVPLNQVPLQEALTALRTFQKTLPAVPVVKKTITPEEVKPPQATQVLLEPLTSAVDAVSNGVSTGLQAIRDELSSGVEIISSIFDHSSTPVTVVESQKREHESLIPIPLTTAVDAISNGVSTGLQTIRDELMLSGERVGSFFQSGSDNVSNTSAPTLGQETPPAVVPTVIAPVTLTNPQAVISAPVLISETFINQLSQYVAYETSKRDNELKGCFSFFKTGETQIACGHKHSRKEKMDAATLLITKSRQWNQGVAENDLSWTEDTIFTTNKKLKKIISDHHYDALKTVFTRSADALIPAAATERLEQSHAV